MKDVEGDFTDTILSHEIMANWGPESARYLTNSRIAKHKREQKALRAADPNYQMQDLHNLSHFMNQRPAQNDFDPQTNRLRNGGVLDGTPVFNIHGRTRRNWENVAHVLESFVQHGGRRAAVAFEKFFLQKNAKQRKAREGQLRHLAEGVFSRLRDHFMESDEAAAKKMGGIVVECANRFRNYMNSAGASKRSFQGGVDKNTRGYFFYLWNFPDTTYSMDRLRKLPGVKKYAMQERRNREQRQSTSLPWHLLAP